MKHPFLTALVVVFLGMLVGIIYFTTTFQSAEAVTATPTSQDVLQAAGESLGASCDAAQAYAFLKSRASGSVQLVPSTTGSSGSYRGGIDPELACRMQRFLQARPDIRIISGYRSVAKQRSICGNGRSKCAPPGKSCHQYGLAVDVSKKDSRTRAQARKFGLHYPYSGPHIQCTEHRRAGCSTSTPPCAKGGIKIDGGPDPGPGYNPSLSSQDLASQLGQGLGASGGGSAGGGSAFGDVAPYNPEDYDPNAYGGEVGTNTDNGFLGDGFGAEALFGEFGEFGEVDETRNILGSDDTQAIGSDDTFSVTQLLLPEAQQNASTGTQDACLTGVPTRTIYGTICKKSTRSTEDATPTPTTFVSTLFAAGADGVVTASDLSSDDGVNVFATYIEPIRHLIDDSSSNQQYRYSGTTVDGSLSSTRSYQQVPHATTVNSVGEAADTSIQSSDQSVPTAIMGGVVFVIATVFKLLFSLFAGLVLLLSTTAF